MVLFKIAFLDVRLIDLFDILVVTIIIYELFLLMKGTRAASMIIGLLLLLLLSFAAQWLRMEGVSWLLSNVQTVWLIAFVILFQPELRRMLVRMGQSRLVRLFYKAGEHRTLDEVVDAAGELSEKGYGALIVLMRVTGIASIIETGVPINAEVSSSLITTIFTPRSPLHDGAVVIQSETLLAARCLLPLSESADVTTAIGTRHLAALGLSEESDALVIVVSEETQAISLAVDGRLKRGFEPEELKEELIGLFKIDRKKKRRSVNTRQRIETVAKVKQDLEEVEAR